MPHSNPRYLCSVLYCEVKHLYGRLYSKHKHVYNILYSKLQRVCVVVQRGMLQSKSKVCMLYYPPNYSKWTVYFTLLQSKAYAWYTILRTKVCVYGELYSEVKHSKLKYVCGILQSELMHVHGTVYQSVMCVYSKIKHIFNSL